MKIYMAPMEGITNHIYRRAYHRWFTPADRYFAPFLTNVGLNKKELSDLLPENNEGMELIPQILTNRPEIFLELSHTLHAFGYTQVNLNLGCPSGTVAAKGRGAGFLRRPQELEEFLKRIFDACPLQISVKTRIGYSDEGEWPALWELLRRFPFSEIIIHPRLRTDFYRGSVRREAFAYAYESIRRQAARPLLQRRYLHAGRLQNHAGALPRNAGRHAWPRPDYKPWLNRRAPGTASHDKSRAGRLFTGTGGRLLRRHDGRKKHSLPPAGNVELLKRIV